MKWEHRNIHMQKVKINEKGNYNISNILWKYIFTTKYITYVAVMRINRDH